MNQQRTITEVERSPWLLPSFAGVIAAATEYRATCGARPKFKTIQAAADYDRGFSAYPAEITDAIDSPAFRGWFDAERRQELRDETLADAAWCEAHE